MTFEAVKMTLPCWKQFLYGMVINMYGVVRNLLMRGARSQERTGSARKKRREVTLVSLSLRRKRNLMWPAKCLHENIEHFTENTLEALGETASELSELLHLPPSRRLFVQDHCLYGFVYDFPERFLGPGFVPAKTTTS